MNNKKIKTVSILLSVLLIIATLPLQLIATSAYTSELSAAILAFFRGQPQF